MAATINKNKLLDSIHTLIGLENEARAFGFEWPNETMIIDQAIDECREIKEAIDENQTRERVQEEIGDLIHSAISLCLFAEFDISETIEVVNSKFGKRMKHMKTLTEN